MQVLVDNPHVGQHLKEKMVLDDMVITDSTAHSFDKSLLLINRVYPEYYVQLHRYDKTTMGNSYLAITRLLRNAWKDLGQSSGGSLLTAARDMARYLHPKGYVAFCFQHVIRMHGEASVSLADEPQHGASLDASALFEEVVDRDDELNQLMLHSYSEIPAMRDAQRIQYHITDGPHMVGPRLRMGWQFAGTARVGDPEDSVIDPEDFSVHGVKGLHVADMSACRESPDISCMGMAYITGHFAAARMLGPG